MKLLKKYQSSEIYSTENALHVKCYREKESLIRRVIALNESLQELGDTSTARIVDVQRDSDSISVIYNGSLDNVLSARSSPEVYSDEYLLALAISIASLVDKLHATGHVIRTLSPEHIIYNSANHQCTLVEYEPLCDLGSASVTSLNELSSLTAINASYLAPEYQINNTQLDWVSFDIYSLGATLYWLFTGESLSQDPVDPGRQPTFKIKGSLIDSYYGLGSIIEKCTAKAPDSRYKSASAVINDLSFCLEYRRGSVQRRHTLLDEHEQPSFRQIVISACIEEGSSSDKITQYYLDSDRVVKHVVFNGAPGTGKSILAHETVRRLFQASRQYLVIDCKSLDDRNNSLLLAIIGTLCKHLTETQHLSSRHILSRIRQNIRLLHLASTQPKAKQDIWDPINLNESELRKARPLDLCSIIRIIASEIIGLVLLIKNIECSDYVSLQYIYSDKCSNLLGNGLYVATYSPSDSHKDKLLVPLHSKLKNDGSLSQFELSVFSRNDIAGILSAFLWTGEDKQAFLVDHLYSAWQGHPSYTLLHLIELVEAGLIHHNQENGLWVYDENAIRSQLNRNDISKDNAPFSSFRDQLILAVSLCSYLSPRFIVDLGKQNGMDGDETRNELVSAQTDRLLVRREIYDDGVFSCYEINSPKRETASIITQPDDFKLSLTYHALAMSNSPRIFHDRYNSISAILMSCTDLIDNDDTLQQCSMVLLRAARYSWEEKQFIRTRDIANHCVRLSLDYPNIHCSAISILSKCNLSLGQFDKVKQVANELLSDFTHNDYKATGFNLRSRLLTVKGDYCESFDECITALRHLNVALALPVNYKPINRLTTAIYTKYAVGKLSLPIIVSSDPSHESQEVGEILLSAMFCGLSDIRRRNFVPALYLATLRFIKERGAIAYWTPAATMLTDFAHRESRDRIDRQVRLTKRRFLLTNSHPLQDARHHQDYCDLTYQLSIGIFENDYAGLAELFFSLRTRFASSGDIVSSSRSCSAYFVAALLSGKNVNALIEEIDTFLTHVNNSDQEESLRSLSFIKFGFEALKDRGSLDRWSVFLAGLGDQTTRTEMIVFQQMLCVYVYVNSLANRHEEVLRVLAKYRRSVNENTSFSPMLRFIRAVSCNSALMFEENRQKRKRYNTLFQQDFQYIQQCAKYNVDSFHGFERSLLSISGLPYEQSQTHYCSAMSWFGEKRLINMRGYIGLQRSDALEYCDLLASDVDIPLLRLEANGDLENCGIQLEMVILSSDVEGSPTPNALTVPSSLAGEFNAIKSAARLVAVKDASYLYKQLMHELTLLVEPNKVSLFINTPGGLQYRYLMSSYNSVIIEATQDNLIADESLLEAVNHSLYNNASSISSHIKDDGSVSALVSRKLTHDGTDFGVICLEFTGDTNQHLQCIEHFCVLASALLCRASDIPAIDTATAISDTFTLQETSHSLLTPLNQISVIIENVSKNDITLGSEQYARLSYCVNELEANIQGLLSATSSSKRVASEHTPQYDLPLKDSLELLDNQRVLVVEDYPAARLGMVELVQHMGGVVSSAEDGESALAMLASDSYDIIYLDLGLPGMSGYDVAKSIRNELCNDDIIIIAVTAYTQESNEVKTISAGMNGFIRKPANSKKIYDATHHLIYDKAKIISNDDLFTEEQHMSVFSSTNIDDIGAYNGWSSSLLAANVAYFLEKYNLDSIATMDEALTNDTDARKAHLHRLKGACRSIGADNFADQLQALYDLPDEDFLSTDQMSSLKDGLTEIISACQYWLDKRFFSSHPTLSHPALQLVEKSESTEEVVKATAANNEVSMFAEYLSSRSALNNKDEKLNRVKRIVLMLNDCHCD